MYVKRKRDINETTSVVLEKDCSYYRYEEVKQKSVNENKRKFNRKFSLFSLFQKPPKDKKFVL